MVKVYNAMDTFEAEVLISELESKGITCYSMESGAGEYFKITANYSTVFGTDIFVSEDDEKEAKEVIKNRLESLKKTNENSKGLSKVRRTRRIFAITMLVVIIGIILIAIFTSFK